MSEAILKKQVIAGPLPSSVSELIMRWMSLWGLPGFEQHIAVSFSSRLHRALGRCYAKRRRITLAERLKEMKPSVLEEVLCHELAHLAVLELFGEKCRPHGSEWARLMRAAGFEPRRRLVLDDGGEPSSISHPRYIYIHYCPVCQSERVARRPVRAWRCASCSALGMDGELEIVKHPDRKETPS